MKKAVLWIPVLLLLSGCEWSDALPYARELGETALVRTVGLDVWEDGVLLSAADGDSGYLSASGVSVAGAGVFWPQMAASTKSSFFMLDVECWMLKVCGLATPWVLAAAGEPGFKICYVVEGEAACAVLQIRREGADGAAAAGEGEVFGGGAGVHAEEAAEFALGQVEGCAPLLCGGKGAVQLAGELCELGEDRLCRYHGDGFGLHGGL